MFGDNKNVGNYGSNYLETLEKPKIEEVGIQTYL